MAESQQGRITWDEDAIAEHDLTRGTRMKIEEPETPFHYPEDDEAMEDANAVAAQANMFTAITNSTTSTTDQKKAAPNLSDQVCCDILSLSGT
jgi:hypothetical protein